ncbi:MAG: hypothetical protein RSE41_02525, partial [Clostridia bacterium]
MNVNDIINSLNVIAENLFKAVEGEVYVILDDIVIISSNILKIEPLKTILNSSGIISIANALILFYITYFMLTQIISLYNGYKTENFYLFIIKIVVILSLVNNSKFLIEVILNILDSITYAIDVFCNNISKQDITFSNLKEKILSIKDFMKNDLISLDGLIKGIISFGVITILINFSVRYVTIILFIIIFPIILITLTSNLTSGIFKTYFKLLTTLLFTQVIVKLVILIPIMYKDVNSIMYKIILVGSIYIIYRINMFVKDLFSKISDESKIDSIFRK